MGRVQFYVQVAIHEPEVPIGIWRVDAVLAERIDRTESDLGRVKAAPPDDALTTLRKGIPQCEFEELRLRPGEYHPRVARRIFGDADGLWRNPDNSQETKNARATAAGQLHALIEQLEHICRVVHPKAPNFTTYGHEIRNVLILACTEVEAQWKAILKASNGKRDNRKDYVKLARPMRLSEYVVALPYYPWMSTIRPFEKWRPKEDDPRAELRWYDTYNAVKHDREQDFQEATLEHAFGALTGFFVMLCAQYGSDFALTGEPASRAFFQLVGAPRWPLCDIYVPPYRSTLAPRPLAL